MKIKELSQKASHLFETELNREGTDPFLSKIVLEAKETAIDLMGEEGGKQAVIKAFLELVIAAHIMGIDLDTEISRIYEQKIAKELAGAG